MATMAQTTQDSSIVTPRAGLAMRTAFEFDVTDISCIRDVKFSDEMYLRGPSLEERHARHPREAVRCLG
jgi:hypothetical protein